MRLFLWHILVLPGLEFRFISREENCKPNPYLIQFGIAIVQKPLKAFFRVVFSLGFSQIKAGSLVRFAGDQNHATILTGVEHYG